MNLFWSSFITFNLFIVFVCFKNCDGCKQRNYTDILLNRTVDNETQKCPPISESDKGVRNDQQNIETKVGLRNDSAAGGIGQDCADPPKAPDSNRNSSKREEKNSDFGSYGTSDEEVQNHDVLTAASPEDDSPGNKGTSKNTNTEIEATNDENETVHDVCSEDCREQNSSRKNTVDVTHGQPVNNAKISKTGNEEKSSSFQEMTDNGTELDSNTTQTHSESEDRGVSSNIWVKLTLGSKMGSNKYNGARDEGSTSKSEAESEVTGGSNDNSTAHISDEESETSQSVTDHNRQNDFSEVAENNSSTAPGDDSIVPPPPSTAGASTPLAEDSKMSSENAGSDGQQEKRTDAVQKTQKVSKQPSFLNGGNNTPYAEDNETSPESVLNHLEGSLSSIDQEFLVTRAPPELSKTPEPSLSSDIEMNTRVGHDQGPYSEMLQKLDQSPVVPEEVRQTAQTDEVTQSTFSNVSDVEDTETTDYVELALSYGMAMVGYILSWVEVCKNGIFDSKNSVWLMFDWHVGQTENGVHSEVDTDLNVTSTNTMTDDGYCSIEDMSCPQKSNYEKIVEFLHHHYFVYLPQHYIVVIFAVVMVSIPSFLYQYLQRSKKERTLIQRINALETEVMIQHKELELLEAARTHPIDSTSDEAKLCETAGDRVPVTDKSVQNLEEKNRKLKNKVMYLEKEIERVTLSALEMHTLLESTLSSVHTPEEDNTREIIEKQEDTINALKKTVEDVMMKNKVLNEDNENLKNSLEKLRLECNVQIKRNIELSDKLRGMKSSLEQKRENLVAIEKSYKQKIALLHATIEDLQLALKKSNLEIKELKDLLIKKKKYVDSDDMDDDSGADAGDDDTSLKVRAMVLEKLNQELTEKLKAEKENKTVLQENVDTALEENEQLQEKYGLLEKQKMELEVKLQVLTDYFKERENHLRREVESKESLCVEKENAEKLKTHKLALLEIELENYKSENETLKKDILNQEKSYKTQLVNVEQKYREYWFAFRQAEGKYKVSEQEASALRNKITILESKLADLMAEKNNSNAAISSAANADTALPFSESLLLSSPDFIPPPPKLPGDGIEFFPPEPLFSPERLSPLGDRRGSSPRLHVDLDDFMPPPPITPPLMNRHIRENVPYTSPPSAHKMYPRRRNYDDDREYPSSGELVDNSY